MPSWLSSVMSQLVAAGPFVLGVLAATQMRLAHARRSKWWMMLILASVGHALVLAGISVAQAGWGDASWLPMLQRVVANSVITSLFSGLWIVYITSGRRFGPFPEVSPTILFGSLLALSQGTVNGWPGFNLGLYVAVMVTALMTVQWIVRSFIRQVVRMAMTVAAVMVIGIGVLFLLARHLPAF